MGSIYKPDGPLQGPLDECVAALERTVNRLVDLHIAEADLIEEWLLETIGYVDEEGR